MRRARTVNRPIRLGIIPARGGSRRLRYKHTRLLLGRPLIAWVIAAARRARTLDAVLVSTDSPAIARAARRAGAQVPFRRPARLATADSPVVETLRHAVREYERLTGTTVGTVVLLQATTPTTAPADIDRCVRLTLRSGYEGALTAFRVDDRPEWCGTRHGRYFRKYFTSRAQRIMGREKYYMATGGVYAVRRASMERRRSIYPPRCGMVLIPPERNTDIDTLKDFLVAETLLRRMRKERKR